MIIITGILGNKFGDLICKTFHIKESTSKELAFGASAYAIGTARAKQKEMHNYINVVILLKTVLLHFCLANRTISIYNCFEKGVFYEQRYLKTDYD